MVHLEKSRFGKGFLSKERCSGYLYTMHIEESYADEVDKQERS